MIKELSYVMLEHHNVMELLNMRKKSKGSTKCEKRTLTCDVRTAQCEDRTVNMRKKVRKPLNVIKELSYVMLEPHNVRNYTM